MHIAVTRSSLLRLPRLSRPMLQLILLTLHRLSQCLLPLHLLMLRIDVTLRGGELLARTRRPRYPYNMSCCCCSSCYCYRRSC